MLERQDTPRLFALPPGADFPRAVVEGLTARLDNDPLALARCELIVNTRRMQRRLGELLATGPARLLPRLTLLADLADDPRAGPLPAAPPPLHRRLTLARLIAQAQRLDPTLAPRSAVFDLADSLASLLDELGGEGVDLATVVALQPDGEAAHRARALTLLEIAAQVIDPADPPEGAARLAAAVEVLAARWRAAPPPHPVLVVGSTGSRAAAARLMETVAKLPQGAVILPGVDDTLPADVWPELHEDHPQFRFRALAGRLGVDPAALPHWTEAPAPDPVRNRLVSLALRPAPVTDRWLAEGPALGDLRAATEGLTLIEAGSSRQEALALALCLRHAAETGTRAALATPDRTLARRVASALRRWGIEPDDSAGVPLALSPPGRLMRQIAEIAARGLSPARLIALLKHPLVQRGGDRGPHLLATRALELWCRRKALIQLDTADLDAFARDDEQHGPWVEWLSGLLDGFAAPGADDALDGHVARLREIAERLVAGADGSPAPLWERAPGEAAARTLEALERSSTVAGAISAAEFHDYLGAVMQREDVRDPATPRPDIMIWGTLEARVQGAELLLLGGLNEGIWPAAPGADPWLNRAMRKAAGLLLPDRQIGLSAHDFQQAIAAGEVVLSRALRDSEADTVPSRWLNRLTSLLGGLPATGGKDALDAMRARGREWIALAAALDRPARAEPPEKAPNPKPPLEARPRRLSVTQIQTLIRDPYAIYARHVLRLAPLDPLHPQPDPRQRGIAAHMVMERFAAAMAQGLPDPVAAFAEIVDAVLAEQIPWAATRAFWRARLVRNAGRIVAIEAGRLARGQLLATEVRGRMDVPGTSVTLTARADRLDRLPGGLAIVDYKSGQVPSPSAIAAFDKQLLLEALIAEAGGFETVPAENVAEVAHIGLGTRPVEMRHPLGPESAFDLAATADELSRLLRRYGDPNQGYASRQKVQKTQDVGDYDHLARLGEWREGST